MADSGPIHLALIQHIQARDVEVTPGVKEMLEEVRQDFIRNPAGLQGRDVIRVALPGRDDILKFYDVVSQVKLAELHNAFGVFQLLTHIPGEILVTRYPFAHGRVVEDFFVQFCDDFIFGLLGDLGDLANIDGAGGTQHKSVNILDRCALLDGGE